jgi:subtilisin family serine protease
MKRYTLSVTSPEYWSEIHDALIVDSNQDGIPDRKITCSDCKDHSPTRGTYELTEAEATEIGNHPHVEWIELSPEDHPGYYRNPRLATKRFPKDVKIYRDLGTSDNQPPSNPTSAEINRTNWAVKRVGIDTNGDFYGTATGNVGVRTANVDFSLTGKNVDIIIHDSGIQQYHPEFIDANGQSRVSDIVLDGPYTIDPAYFNTNSLTYTKTDGRVGIATTAAHEWWENASKRSGSFSSVGTVAIGNAYTMNNAMGIGGTVNGLTSGHGTSSAGLAAGKNFGLAFEANIWNMPAIGDAVSMAITNSYDLMKIFHQNKPINSTTGRKNPTVINGSWGYQAYFFSGTTVSYRFQGATGTFTGNDSVTNLVTAMKQGLNNQVQSAYRSWSTGSASNSTDTAGKELMDAGVIYVAAAGNNNQRLGIGADDVDRLNYMTDAGGYSNPMSGAPSNTAPCNHRDWMNPQGIGFSTATDFHPVICVGAIEEHVATGTSPSGLTALSEYQASYSNNGPGIDVWAPADETLSAGTNGVSLYEDFTRPDDGITYTSNTTGSDYFDNSFNGTSAAAPVVTGLIALYLETNPTATSRQVKDFIFEQGSVVVADDLYADQYSDSSQTQYWTGSYNLRGAQRRILRDLSASPTEPSIKGVSVTGISFKQS